MTTHRTAVHFGVLALLALSAPASAAGLNDYSCKLTSAHPRPVVLVHGRGGDVQGFQTLIGALGAAGYCVFDTNYGQVGGQGPNGLDHLTVSAAEIRDFVNEVLAKTGARQVDVIGHSAGTGVLDNFILQKGGAAVAHRLVSFGGLHHPYAHVGASGFADSDLFLPNLILAARLIDPNITAQQVITDALALYAGAGGSLAGVDVTTATSNFANDLFDPDYWRALHGNLSEPPAVFIKVATAGRTLRTADAAPSVCYTNIVGVADVLAGASSGFQDAAPNVDNFLLLTLSDHSQILDDAIAVNKALTALAAPCAVSRSASVDGDGPVPGADGGSERRGCAFVTGRVPATSAWPIAGLIAALALHRRRRSAA